MSEQFNIFGNLDALKNVNLLDKLKSLEKSNAKKNSNIAVSDDDDSDLDKDFESMLNNNVPKKSPSKRRKKNDICPRKNHNEDKSKEDKETENLATSPKDKTKKKGRKSIQRRSTTSSERSLSPTMDCLVGLDKNAGHSDVIIPPPSLPVATNINLPDRVTRSNFEALRRIAEANAAAAAEAERRQIENTGKRNGRARGKGRGRGRGRNASDENTLYDNNCLNNINSDAEYVPQPVGEPITQAPSYTASPIEILLQMARGRGRRQTASSRRAQMAEIAARSTHVDFVDLISSPMPRVEGTITLDSDGEVENHQPISLGKSKKPNEKPSVLDISLEDDNPEMSVKVKWNGKPEAFKLRKYQKFSVIFQKLAERENAAIENIILNLDDRIITADDTPDSIDYKIFQFINGRVLTMNFNSPLAVGKPGVTKKQRSANQISVKIQSDKWKRPLQIDIKKTDLFRILYIKCAEELSIGMDKISLSFDGEPLELNDTPADIDLEGGEVIDLRLRD
ncbi:DNA repair protein Rad60 [Musca autumnalis]|uniref:DNA repair protein Rad60 n=1 Tax=Musca autumnalis TaxID=221902 RepID=UPI003CF73E29